MKEREPLNFARTIVAPPVGRRWAILGGGIFNRNYGQSSTGVDRRNTVRFRVARPLAYSRAENETESSDAGCNTIFFGAAKEAAEGGANGRKHIRQVVEAQGRPYWRRAE